MLKKGELKVHIEERVPFAESPIRAALEKMKERRTRGKIIVVVDKE
jgi:NADPH:quinone reductase-like Zn-dependent oxidoreductase